MAASHSEKGEKLAVLQQTYELEERKAIEEKRKIDLVVEEREAIVAVVEAQLDELQSKLRQMQQNEKRRAVTSGDGGLLASVERYRRRVQDDVHRLGLELQERQSELSRARERLQIAEQDLVAARLEKKKVERLLERRELSARINAEAVEEAETDEMSFFTRKR